MAKRLARCILTVILAMAMLPSAGATEPAQHSAHVGDSYVFHRQVWSFEADGSAYNVSGPAYRVDLRDVQSRADAAGYDRDVVVIDLTWVPWEHEGGRFLANTTQRVATLLVDLGSGHVIGIAHNGFLTMGTPEQPPADAAAFLPEGTMPCLVASLVTSIRAPTSAPTEGIAECGQFGTRVRSLSWQPTTTPVDDGEAAKIAHIDRTKLVSWGPSTGPATRLAVVFPLGPNPENESEALDYLAEMKQGSGPALGALLSQAATVQRGLTAGSFTLQGPQDGGAPFALTLARAAQELSSNPAATLTKQYLASHPKARLSELDYWNGDSNGTGPGWTFIWSDPSGEGHGARVSRELTAVPSASAVTVRPLLPDEYNSIAFPLQTSAVPETSLKLDDVVRLARAAVPPWIQPGDIQAFSWTTFARESDGAISNRPNGTGTSEFAYWRAQASFAAAPAGGVVEVSLDPSTGRIDYLASTAWTTAPLPLDSPNEPRYAALADAFGPVHPDPSRGASPQLLLGAAIVLTLGGLAVTGIGQEIVTRFLVVPLYARIRSSSALDHPIRKRIVDLLRSEPGSGVAGICSALNLAEGTARYHLGILKSRGFVREVSLDGMTGYRLTTTNQDEATRGMATRHPHAERIIEAIASSNEPLTLREISDRAGVPTGAAYHHLMRMAGRGLVVIERRSRALRYRVSPMN